MRGGVIDRAGGRAFQPLDQITRAKLGSGGTLLPVGGEDGIGDRAGGRATKGTSKASHNRRRFRARHYITSMMDGGLVHCGSTSVVVEVLCLDPRPAS